MRVQLSLVNKQKTVLCYRLIGISHLKRTQNFWFTKINKLGKEEWKYELSQLLGINTQVSCKRRTDNHLQMHYTFIHFSNRLTSSPVKEGFSIQAWSSSVFPDSVRSRKSKIFEYFPKTRGTHFEIINMIDWCNISYRSSDYIITKSILFICKVPR